MGANYDVLLLRSENERSASAIICKALSTLGKESSSIELLSSIQINDDRAVLFSKPVKGWLQLIANHASLGISLHDWFLQNPFAVELSRQSEPVLQIWSLNSGQVSGYALYTSLGKQFCESKFSIFAKNTLELIPTVPTPENRPFPRTYSNYELPIEIILDANSSGLEKCMARLVKGFGFSTHLIDYYDAVDDGEGITIDNDHYKRVALNDWSAVLFK